MQPQAAAQLRLLVLAFRPLLPVDLLALFACLRACLPASPLAPVRHEGPLTGCRIPLTIAIVRRPTTPATRW